MELVNRAVSQSASFPRPLQDDFKFQMGKDTEGKVHGPLRYHLDNMKELV